MAIKQLGYFKRTNLDIYYATNMIKNERKNNKKKRFVTLMIAGVMALTLVACGTAGGSSSTEATASATRKSDEN